MAARLSRRIFGGAQYRIRIGAAIGEAGQVANTAELADALTINRQSVNKELLLLEEVGLLRRVDSGERKVYWVAEESRYWSLCRELADAAGELLLRNRAY